MAVKFGIRNYSRVGNQVTFTLVALNADGTIDTNYTGAFTWGLNGMSDPGLALFSAGDMGQRTYTTTILDPNVRTGVAANFPGSANGANLSVSPPGGTPGVSFGNAGDHLLVGGAGNDTINGNNGNDLFLLQQGGNDTVHGGGGDDGFYFGAAYTVADVVNGGAGTRDQVALQGNYAGGVTLGSLVGVEMVVLLPGNDNRFGGGGGPFSYAIVADANTVVSGNRITVQANTLRASENFSFDGSASGIDFLIYAGLGANFLTGGSGDDGFFFGQFRFTPNDFVNGGGGSDQLGLQGSYLGASAINFGAGQVTNVEFIVLLSASDNRFGAFGGIVNYDLTMHDSMVAAGQSMVIQANTLRAGETFIFNGAFENDGSFRIFSGAADDFIVGSQNADEIWGGAGNDFIVGTGGADILRGGAGNDTFSYREITDSTPGARDQILDFASGDLISLAALASNTGGGNFTFIGDGAQTGARQVQVSQTGNQATVNVYLDGDANPDMVIDVTLLGGLVLGIGDFSGVSAMQRLDQPKDAFDTLSGGGLSKLWSHEASGAAMFRLGDPDLIDMPGALHALPGSSDLLI